MLDAAVVGVVGSIVLVVGVMVMAPKEEVVATVLVEEGFLCFDDIFFFFAFDSLFIFACEELFSTVGSIVASLFLTLLLSSSSSSSIPKTACNSCTSNVIAVKNDSFCFSCAYKLLRVSVSSLSLSTNSPNPAAELPGVNGNMVTLEIEVVEDDEE